MTLTAFDLTGAESYVLNEVKRRASSEGFASLQVPNQTWREKLDGLVAKGFLRNVAHDVWELVG